MNLNGILTPMIHGVRMMGGLKRSRLELLRLVIEMKMQATIYH